MQDRYYDDLYSELIESLRNRILNEYGSIKSFSEKISVSRYNLSRVFRGNSKISLGLYMKICAGLNVLPSGRNFEAENMNSIVLYDYLKVNHDDICKSILKVMFLNA